MATEAEKFAGNVQSLNETKQAIKTAIENKGQDLNGVPFTGYASKIEAIQSGGSSEDTELLRQILTRTSGIGMFRGCTQLKTIPQVDTSGFDSIQSMFQDCKLITTIPEIDTSKATDMQYTFRGCDNLVTIPELDTSKVTNMFFMFYYDIGLVTVPKLDVRNVTNLNYMFDGCKKLQTCLIRNIKVNLKVGSTTNWGHLLTQESALHLCKECIQDRDNAHTITFATSVYNNLETLYVRQITITDEMRAEDDLIDKKRPFEVCESTDSGAMTIANYMTLKNWSIAK